MSNTYILQKYKTVTNDLIQHFPPEEARAMARIIVEKVTSTPIHSILANPYLGLGQAHESEIDIYVSQLKLQKPIQYILGEAQFFNINLKVNPNVLIPRPETEELVHWIVNSNATENPSVLDIGTGSGCIAIAIAKNIVGSMVFAMDISPKAIALAKQNAKEAEVEVIFDEQDILSLPKSIKGAPFDIIVSNPPYVRNSERSFMDTNVLDHEPELALFVSDGNPLVFYKAIAQVAQTALKPNGFVYFEINEAFGNETAEVLSSFGFVDIEIRKDINGKDRMVRGRKC
jgi:release factor glutamine methyltransferase